MNTPRDTQFAGFAKLLYEDFIQLRDEESVTNEAFDEARWRRKVEQLIARRAYDLVGHALIYSYTHSVTGTREEAANQIPDLIELPEVNQ